MKLLGVLILTCGFVAHGLTKRMEEKDVVYLVDYGYMEPTVDGEEHTDEDMKAGLERFQQFNGMDVTGDMSEAMHEMMAKPRCGLKDMNLDMPSHESRARRYTTTGTRWPNPNLTYKYENYYQSLSQSDTRNAIEKAFAVWSDVTPLTFREVGSNEDADIVILFRASDHGDGSPFDGPNGVLAHAYFPSPGLGGDAHFDAAENFAVNGDRNRIDLFQVGAHEFGHSMGLGHSDVPGALMAPYYAGYIPNFKLPQDDINGIQYLYGRPVETPTDPQDPDTGVVTQAPTNPPVVPDVCKTNIDAVVYDQTGIYIFQGKEITRLEMRGTPMPGYPQRISNVFNGLENNIDAAYYRFRTRSYIFFKKDQYWEFDRFRNLRSGFPKAISEFSRELPNDLDAVVTWGSRYTFIFKGSEYWRYNERYGRMDSRYPRSITQWRGVPSNPDAGFRWLDGELYFIKDGEYYFYDTRIYGVDPNVFPRSFGEDWLSCLRGSYEYNPSSAHMHVYSLSALLMALACVIYL